MPRPSRWRDLRVGLAAIAALSILTAAILYFGRLGRLPGETYRVFVRAEEARGIMDGSEVWLAGQKIGAVRRITFLPPGAATTKRVLLEVELVKRHQPALRHDSSVEIRAGGSLIGAPVVSLGMGSAAAGVVAEGDTITATERADLEGIASRYASVSAELPDLAGEARTVMALLRDPSGTLGAAMAEHGRGEIAEARARADAIVGNVRNSGGTLGLVLQDRGALMERARVAVSRVDSIRALLGSDRTSLGRFRRDSTLLAHMADIRNELSIVEALLASPDGTLGRLAADSAIIAGLAAVEQQMSGLLADVKARPFRYLSF